MHHRATIAAAALGSCLLGCTAPPAKSEPAAAPGEPSDAEPVPSPTGSTAGPAAPDPASAKSSADSLLTAALSHPDFAMYLHPEVPGRVPVVVTGFTDPEGRTLVLDGTPLVLASAPPPNDAAFVDVGSWAVRGGVAKLELEYAVEGVSAQFKLQRSPKGWVVSDVSVAER
ncbi:MAG: hypothetical protein AAF721_03615 [Myxococcota bacterium]